MKVFDVFLRDRRVCDPVVDSVCRTQCLCVMPWVEAWTARIVAESQGRYDTIRPSPEWRNRQTQGT
jgi:hypothetical protein